VGQIARHYYATPAELGFKPWALDFAPDNYGNDPFPMAFAHDAVTARWSASDWDPALRFWCLPFDPNLGEWLRDQDPVALSTLAAREFAGEHAKWQFDEPALKARNWITDAQLGWKTKQNQQEPKDFIRTELSHMFRDMEDDRDRWLAEAHWQADGLAGYFVHLLGIDTERRPWTFELIRCALAIGNLVYMHYKARFNRVRPSFLCPGLIPPFGPPRHPAFPSGHSFLGHFVSLVLLTIPEVADRYGEDKDPLPIPPNSGVRMRTVRGVKPSTASVLRASEQFGGPLLWFANRLARNRERIGVHYPSDSAFGRQLAGAIDAMLLTDPGQKYKNGADKVHWSGLDAVDITFNKIFQDDRQRNMEPKDLIVCPSLHRVLAMAKAEWQTGALYED